MDAKCGDCGRGYSNVSIFWRCPVCATENRCTQPTDTQQLKAEIAALAIYCDQSVMVGFSTPELDILLKRLRQLSAV